MLRDISLRRNLVQFHQDALDQLSRHRHHGLANSREASSIYLYWASEWPGRHAKDDDSAVGVLHLLCINWSVQLIVEPHLDLGQMRESTTIDDTSGVVVRGAKHHVSAARVGESNTRVH